MYKFFSVSLLVFALTLSLLTSFSQAQEVGTLQVFSEEPGAYIYIDGHLKGKESVIKNDLVVGEHYLKVIKEGTNDTLFSEIIKINPKEVRTILVPALLKMPAKAAPAAAAEAKVEKPAPVKKIIKIPTLPLTLGAFTPELRAKRIAAVDVRAGGGIKGFRENQETKETLAGIKALYIEKSEVDAIKAGELVLNIDGMVVDNLEAYEKLVSSLKIDSAIGFEIFGEDNKKRRVELKVGSIEKEEIAEVPAAPAVEMVKLIPNAKLFHKIDSDHVSGPDVITLPRAEAEAKGYSPCNICYPEEAKVSPPAPAPAETGVKEVKETTPAEAPKEEIKVEGEKVSPEGTTPEKIITQ